MADQAVARSAVEHIGTRKQLEHGIRKMKVEDLTLVRKIGHGVSSDIFSGYWKGWEGDVAIKQISTEYSNEISFLSELKHPNIITLYGTATEGSLLCIVQELAERGSLQEHIARSRGKPDINWSMRWAEDVANGMRYLHEKDIVHRDLKSSNIMLTSALVAKVGDFNITRKMDHATRATKAGTYHWMAPEVILEQRYSKTCDLFSYGMVLWELVTHEVPFEELKGVLRIQMAIVHGEMPAIPEYVEEYLTRLIKDCWNKDPNLRPSFGTILAVLNSNRTHTSEAVRSTVVLDDSMIEYNEIDFGKSIGHGKCGTVCAGKWGTLDVAIKELPVNKKITQEVRIMFGLNHSNIIKLYGTATTDYYMYIVLELAEFSLGLYIKKHKGNPHIETSLQWAVQIAEGMRYLHEREIAHRDLKSSNVLLTTAARVAKISDFGAARQLDHKTKATQTGTVEWMAPEVINNKEYSKRCDLFSYGTVLWELVTHEVPFEGVSHYQTLKAIVSGKMPLIPTTLEKYLSTLLQYCWKEDPEDRPTFAEILSVLARKAVIQEHANTRILYESLEIQGRIAENVFKSNWKVNDKQVAIKKLHYTEGVVKEVSIMSALKHLNIISLYGTASRKPNLYIVQELAVCSLSGHIQTHKSNPQLRASLRWAAEIAEGMRYLHKKKIVHRDLKSPNVLLSKTNVAKICDFGSACQWNEKISPGQAVRGCTVQWMAPELIDGGQHSECCDLFSYGMVLWELVTHEVPFEELKADFHIMSAIDKGEMPAIPSSVEDYLTELIKQCWNREPEERPSFVKIFSSLMSKSC